MFLGFNLYNWIDGLDFIYFARRETFIRSIRKIMFARVVLELVFMLKLHANLQHNINK